MPAQRPDIDGFWDLGDRACGSEHARAYESEYDGCIGIVKAARY